TLTAATVVGATSYNWSVPGSATIVSGQGTNVITVNVGTASGTASVTVTDPCGTSAPATFSYTVNLNPVITATSNTSAVCAGSSATLTVTGATIYSWSSGGTDSTEVVSPTSPTMYTVIGSDSIGCADTATVSIDVNALPIVNLGADTAQCGGSITLDAQNSGSTYLWSDNSTTQIITVSATGTYDVAVMDINGCVGRDTTNVTINPLPVVVGSAAMTTVCLDDAAVALFGSPAGGAWTGPATSGSSFFPDSAGMGTHVLVYQYTDSLGCSGMDSVSIDVQLCTGIDPSAEAGFGVYPNPNNGTFTIVLNKNVTELVIEITDLQGRIVYTSNNGAVAAGFVQQVSLENEASGMYLVRIVADGVMSVQRVSVQK
ncbi:MAG TPA: T9SS type A sorting domain-containing protein, partial [Bacteroidia bacterium]|nr:T9SS type A sorting domain-containing protein [Bacteroidia bacterium]